MRALALALAAAVAAHAAARETVPFDLGWLNKVGISPPSGKCDFPINVSGVECLGLGQGVGNTPEECAGSCCLDPDCEVWQFAPLTPAPQGGCWVGQPQSCSSPSSEWIGGRRAPPPPNPHPNATGPALPGYDDHDWDKVTAPHDFLIDSPYSPNNTEGNAFRSRNTSWYRKHFAVPQEWSGKSVYVRFGGVFHQSQWFINGEFAGRHDNGYTSFVLRLDNASLSYGTEPTNVLAGFVDALDTSSWWYAGGGLYRHVELFATERIHVAEDGLHATARIDEASVRGGLGARATADGHVYVEVEIANDGVPGVNVTAKATLTDASGAAVASCTTGPAPAKEAATVSCSMPVSGAALWSVADPALYTVTASVSDGSADLDDVSTTVGFRSMEYNSEDGFKLNGERVAHTGFCDHNDQAVVGMAVPDRLFLHRFQMLRAIGGNARRMSHNSPSSVILELTDRLGVLTMPENRNFLNTSDSFRAWHDLLKHHRNHPSVAFFSECNEVGCWGPNDALAYVSDKYMTIAAAIAPEASITANQFEPMIGNAQSITLDVQGFSHQGVSVFETFHKQFPQKAAVASECCSCESQRDEDSSNGHYAAFNADCVREQTNWALNGTRPDFNTVGTYTWTMMDYYGEGHSWPEVGSSYGQFDRTVFAKQAARYYRAAWLTSRPDTVPGRPPVVAAPEVSIVESWDSDGGAGPRDLHVYCGGDGVAQASLSVNGKAFGSPQPCAGYTYAAFKSVPYAPGSVTASALDASGKALAASTTHTSGDAASLSLSVDAPSPSTGTGSAIVADGVDAALIRATLLDKDGNRARGSAVNVTFAVTGPAELLGCGNGDPRNLVKPTSFTCPAYHGLVRAVVRVRQVSTGGAASSLDRLVAVHGGAERLRDAGLVVAAPGSAEAASIITVTATSAGLTSGSVDVSVSSDAADSVLATASKYAANVTLSLGDA